MELPCDDGAATFDDYADAVCAALADDGDDVVLVGHSLGGHTVARVASRRPLRHLVYLCGVPPVPGQTMAQQMSADTDMFHREYLDGITAPDEQGRTRWVDLEVATRVLFADCDTATVADAFARLRPQGSRAYRVPYAAAAYPAVTTTSIVCADDRMVNPDWQRRVARDRLSANIIEMPGDHSPFLSRPAQLAAVLHGLTVRS